MGRGLRASADPAQGLDEGRERVTAYEEGDGALHDVAKDDTAFDQALQELPLTGAQREIAERFLRSYRESVLER